MKNVLVIVGSARQGNSLYAGNLVKEIANEIQGIACDVIELAKLKINYCDGCLVCDSTGVCHYTDDMEHIIAMVKVANGIVFISPTRWSLLSGDMKVFMDRLNPLAGRSILNNKKSFIVAIGQTNLTDSVSITHAIESLKFFSDDAGLTFVDGHTFTECLEPSDISKRDTELSSFTLKVKDFFEKC